MKKILLINFDARTVGNLQAEYVRQCEFFSTNDFDIAYQLIKRGFAEVVFMKVPNYYNFSSTKETVKFLKKLKKKEFSDIKKIVVAEKGGEFEIEGFMKYGISAVILDVGEVGRWVE